MSSPATEQQSVLNDVDADALGAVLVEEIAVGPLTHDVLAWIARTPRSYAETMEAWRSSCPRLTIWEDALADGLFRVERADNQRLSECMVVLTPRGRAVLDHLHNEQSLILATR
ncbi:MAG: hypothetical protein ACRDJW_23815 [Thermomicrobiales bacterium]